jgi:hypothetical protein
MKNVYEAAFGRLSPYICLNFIHAVAEADTDSGS